MFIWVALIENARRTKILWTITDICLNPGFLQELKKKLLCSGKTRRRSYDMEGDAKKCVERGCELANKTTNQLYNFTTPCLDEHQFKEEGPALKTKLRCLYLARIGRQTFHGPQTNWHEQ